MGGKQMGTRITTATFASRENAEMVAKILRQNGFDKEISIISKEKTSQQITKNGNSPQFNNPEILNLRRDDFREREVSSLQDSVIDGTSMGATLGALTGLAAGATFLAIPGLGFLAGAGPIAGILSGSAIGGLSGALVDYGIPEPESNILEQEVNQGKILMTIESSDKMTDSVQEIVLKHGGKVNQYKKN